MTWHDGNMPDDQMASEREFNEHNIDDKIYIVGSAAGRDQSPAWVFNLRAHPDVSVEIGSDPPKSVVARELPRDERDQIFASVKARAPGFAEYEERTERVIPVFELTSHA